MYLRSQYYKLQLSVIKCSKTMIFAHFPYIPPMFTQCVFNVFFGTFWIIKKKNLKGFKKTSDIFSY